MATDLTYPNVPDLANADSFDTDVEYVMFEAGAFKKIDSAVIRQLLANSLFKSGTANPTASEVIADTTVWYVNTTDNSLHISLAGATFIAIATATTPLTGLQIVALLAALTGTDRLPASAIRDLPDPLDGADIVSLLAALADGDRLPATAIRDFPNGMTMEEIRDAMAVFIVGGNGIEAQHNDGADTLTLSLHASQVVSVLEGLSGNNRLNASAIRNLPSSSSGPSLNVAIRPPVSSDVIANTDYIWVDTIRDALYISVSGGAWQPIIPSSAISEQLATSDAVDYALQSPGSANPTSGQIIYTTDGTTLKISEEDAETTPNTQVWSHIGAGDQIWVGGSAVFKASATPTRDTSDTVAFWEFTGQWLRRDDTLAGSDVVVEYVHVERSLKERNIHDFHIAPDSVGAYELKPQTVTQAELADNVVQPGSSISLGGWQRLASGNPSADGNFASTSTTFLLYYTNAGATDREDVLRTVRAGDRFYFDANLNTFTVSAVSFGTDYATFTGDWAGTDPDQTNYGASAVDIYLVRGINHIGTDPMVSTQMPVVQSDYSVQWETPTAQSDETPAVIELASGVYTILGSWTWGSSTIPNTAGFYVGSAGITINNQDTAGNDKTSDLQSLVVGDRLQVGEVNALDITTAPVEASNNTWLIRGSWEATYRGADFDGTLQIRVIKKNNIVVQGNVVPGGVLRLNDDLAIEVDDPDDALVDLWTGTLGADEADTNYDINAGELFSDYSHVVFNYTGTNYRNVKEAPVQLWQALTRIEVSNKTNSMAVRRIDNNTFRIEAVTGSIRLRAIHGYKGV